MGNKALIDIPGFSLGKKLGEGGMATVYAAIQQGFDRPVAVKIIAPDSADMPDFGDRFLREARIVGRLSHPNIVPVYDVGKIGDYYYLAMELLEDGDLTSRINTGLDANTVLLLTRQIASALAYAHSKGFIHRDIKPDNIMFRNTDTAVLTDFGIARANADSTVASNITQVRTIIGSPAYMSPEQALGNPVDNRSDLYSLGVVLYQMLTGEVPFKGKTVAEISLDRFERQMPRLPDDLSAIQPLLEKLLAYSADKRYPACNILIDAIDALLKQSKSGSGLDKERFKSDAHHTAIIEHIAQEFSQRNGRIMRHITRSTPIAFALIATAGLAVNYYVQPAVDKHSPAATAGKNKKEKGQLTLEDSALLAVPRPAEYFEFRDILASDNSLSRQEYIKRYPGSVLADILRLKSEDKEAFLATLQQRADSGDWRANLVLSERFAVGIGTAADRTRAISYAEQAAVRQNDFAQYHLALLLLNGQRDSTQEKKAMRMLKAAANNGFYLAETVIANLYFNGAGVQKNTTTALKYFQRAATQGDRNAKYNLAMIYQQGLGGIARDPMIALQHLKSAADLGHRQAIEAVSKL
jgi:serine/threonine protein kinase